MDSVQLHSSYLQLFFRQKIKEDVSHLLTVCHQHCNNYQPKWTEDSKSYHNELPWDWTLLNEQNKAIKSSTSKEHTSILIMNCVAWKQGEILYKSMEQSYWNSNVKIVYIYQKWTHCSIPTCVKEFEPISALALYCEYSWFNLEEVEWQKCALTQLYRNRSTFYRGLWRQNYTLSTRYQTGACISAKRMITEDGEEGNRDGRSWELVGNCNSSGTDTSPSFKGLISELSLFPCTLEFVLHNSKYFLCT